MAGYLEDKSRLSEYEEKTFLLALEQEQGLVLTATVKDGQTLAIDGPNLQVDWTSLHMLMDIVVNALIAAGSVHAELLKRRERYVRGKKGMNMKLVLYTAEPLMANAQARLAELAQYILVKAMQKPADRAVSQLELLGNQVDSHALQESVERSLDESGGRNIKSAVQIEIVGRPMALLKGHLGKKRDKSNFQPHIRTLIGTFRGYINEPRQRCLLFRLKSDAAIDINFEESQLPTTVNLEVITRLNKQQAVCEVKVTATTGTRGQDVYVFQQMKELPPRDALLFAQQNGQQQE